MARRSTSAARSADRKFPVRVKVRVPPTGPVTMIGEIGVWLETTIGADGQCQGTVTTGDIDATAFRFMAIKDA